METFRTTPLEEAMAGEAMVPIIGASMLGTLIGWYDVYLTGFFSLTVFPSVFFPTWDPFAGMIASFTTGFVGFAARPIGGALFGWFGDRIGRRATLVATLLLMGVATLLMGVLPGYATLGIAAPILLASLRFVQGVGIGGEWGGAVLLTMEYGDNRRRGFWASWPQAAVPVALALSTLVVLLFKDLYPGVAFVSIGWRMPFFLDAMLVLIALYIRLRIGETPSFTRLLEKQDESSSPLMDALHSSWREIALSALLRSGEQAPFYIFTFFALSYGEETLHVNPSLLYIGLSLAGLISCVSMPTFSAVSDRFGRKRWSLIGTIVMGVYALPYFLLMNTHNLVLVVLAIVLSLSLCHAWLYGPQAALIAERFPTRHRYTGASIGYQLASLTAGGPAPIIATYLQENYGKLVPGYPAYVLIAAYIVIMCVVSFFAILPLKDYTGKAAAGDNPA
jgi:MFS family permease